MKEVQNSFWTPDSNQPTVMIWDRAPWHSRADIVQQQASRTELGFILIQLPSDSPDLSPID